jgi:hypothetical protein
MKLIRAKSMASIAFGSSRSSRRFDRFRTFRLLRQLALRLGVDVLVPLPGQEGAQHEQRSQHSHHNQNEAARVVLRVLEHDLNPLLPRILDCL